MLSFVAIASAGWGNPPPPPPPPPTAMENFLQTCDDCHLTADAFIICLLLCGASAGLNAAFATAAFAATNTTALAPTALTAAGATTLVLKISHAAADSLFCSIQECLQTTCGG